MVLSEGAESRDATQKDTLVFERQWIGFDNWKVYYKVLKAKESGVRRKKRVQSRSEVPLRIRRTLMKRLRMSRLYRTGVDVSKTDRIWSSIETTFYSLERQDSQDPLFGAKSLENQVCIINNIATEDDASTCCHRHISDVVERKKDLNEPCTDNEK
jgi:hypothetical protein